MTAASVSVTRTGRYKRTLHKDYKEAQLVPGCLWVEGHYLNMGSFVVSLNMFPSVLA